MRIERERNANRVREGGEAEESELSVSRRNETRRNPADLPLLRNRNNRRCEQFWTSDRDPTDGSGRGL